MGENSIEKQLKMKKSSKKMVLVAQTIESTKKQLPNNQDKTNLISEEKFSLYVRGSAWIKDRENAVNRLKEIEPRIQSVRHPRQKGADYCFIDFESALDRDQSYEKLKKHTEINVKPVVKDVPKLLEKRRQKIAEKREAKLATKNLIRQIKKKEKMNAKATEKTNQIVILNLPKQVTQIELKAQYPNAIKVIIVKEMKKQTKGKRTAIITFPNHRDAFAASKEESLNLHGHKINVLLNTFNLKQNAKKKKTVSEKSHEPPKKVPKIEK